MADSPNSKSVKPQSQIKKKKKRRLRKPVKVVLVILGLLLCVLLIRGITSLFSSSSGDNPGKDKDPTTENNNGNNGSDPATEKDLQKLLGYTVYPDNGQTVATVLIDAGHGASDGGNLTETNDPDNPVLEKDINLKAALLLKEAFQEINPQIKVEMTRTSDKTDWDNSDGDEIKDLDNRIDLIKKYNADYFISLHCNTYDTPDVYGYDMYIRPDDPASKAIAQGIADDFEKIDWSQFRSITDTDHFPLHVVELASAPSILLEMGFMSNPDELKSLQDENNLKEMMTCAAAAYSQYIMAHPEGPEKAPETKDKDKDGEENQSEEEKNTTGFVLPSLMKNKFSPSLL